MKVLTMYKENPIAFFKAFFPRITMLEWFQEETLLYLGDWKKRQDYLNDTKSLVVITSGRGVGKSQLNAMVAIWVMCCFEQPIIRMVSSKLSQTKDVLIDTTKLLLNNSLLKDVYVSTALSISLKDKDGKPEKFQSISTQVVNERNPAGTGGDHRPYQLLCIDEAQSMSQEAYYITTGIVATGVCFIMVTGNPADNNNILYELSHNENIQERYKSFTVSGHDIKRLDYNLDAMIEHYGGKTSPFYRMYVCGEWLDNYEGRLFLNSAIDRFLDRPALDFPLDENCVIGVDVSAGMGADATCIVARKEMHVKILNYDNELSGDQLVDLLISYCSNGATLAFDCDGIGSLLIANLKPHIQRFRKVRSGGQPRKAELFKNLKAEMFYTFADIVNDGGLKLRSSQYRDQLKKEMKTIKYEIKDGKVEIIQKHLLAKSPDIADAIAYTFVNGIKTVKMPYKQDFMSSFLGYVEQDNF